MMCELRGLAGSREDLGELLDVGPVSVYRAAVQTVRARVSLDNWQRSTVVLCDERTRPGYDGPLACVGF